MIEGQEDVTWDDSVAIAKACERSGVRTLFRSDHYLSVEDKRERGSLDALATPGGARRDHREAAAGDDGARPATFRHPSVFAKLVVTVDQIKRRPRRAGGWEPAWSDREHEAYGFDLPEARAGDGRLRRAAERSSTGHLGGWPVQLRRGALQDRRARRAAEAGAAADAADHRRLGRAAQPAHRGRGGPPSTTPSSRPEELGELRAKLDAECERQGRDPATLPLSVMTGWIVGETREALVERAGRLASWRGRTATARRSSPGCRDAWITGTVEEAVEQLRALAEAGCARVMAQQLLHRDLEAIATIGREVIPMKGSDLRFTKMGPTGVDVSVICLGCMGFGDGRRQTPMGARRGRQPRDHQRGARRRDQLLRHRQRLLARRQRGDHRPGPARHGATATRSCSPPRSTADARGPERRRPLPQGDHAEIDNSLRRLGTDYVDLYQIHRWDYDTPDRGDAGGARTTS